MKFLISFLLLQSITFAACLETTTKDIQVKWTAFKTPEKVGVGGTFKKVKFASKLKGDSITSVIKKAKFSIDSSSVFTKNSARDMKISKFFFKPMMDGAKIEGEVVSMNAKKVVVLFKMNKKSVKVPLNYTVSNNELKASGTLDVLDFSLNSQLAALNKACFAKHKGKTWSDVDVVLMAKFKKCK
ncbi:hypothetical protein A9Q84_09615 [Halobacteriovorax marinus]|uniref:Lipid/polyisoprenoid-binding YceI-like domain-containing protein n=1 Tax=Halobacteriovorax marinus TaxID=97084 RepID=A0A1Y5F720_9BACT|nr:hypothetical protein A9Q84_09615 [Halobacteriovorax marinus]